MPALMTKAHIPRFVAIVPQHSGNFADLTG
jgi:hypothetical protein